MLRFVLISCVCSAATGVVGWNVRFSEYFGRVDAEPWQREHPAPPTPQVRPGPHVVEVVQTRRIVPGEGLPPEAEVYTANNNLDVVRHTDGRVYLAWRTAPSHFAGSQTVINVVSSADEVSWRFESRFALGTDLREPRFLPMGDRLLLYVSRLGSNPFDFEPAGMSVSERDAGGRWGALQATGPAGFIGWRARWVAGQAFMIGYVGGGSIYSLTREPLSVRLLTTRDGLTWQPAFGTQAELLRGGGSEADFHIDTDGRLTALVRNEAGDEGGFGSKLCAAEPDAPARWRCRDDPRKFDSPLLFSHDGQVYAVARRNRTLDGLYDVAHGPWWWRLARNQLAYITAAKRCALWRLDPAHQTIDFVLDLPSRGDTCFASVLPGSVPNEVVLYDYSSPLDGPDLPWAAGQRRPTYIYRHVLAFSPDPKSAAREVDTAP